MNLAGKPRRTGKYRLEAQGDIIYAHFCQQHVGSWTINHVLQVMQKHKKYFEKSKKKKGYKEFGQM